MDPVPNDKVDCPHCKHPSSHHFSATDEIGYWSFCVLEDCDCFLDIANGS